MSRSLASMMLPDGRFYSKSGKIILEGKGLPGSLLSVIYYVLSPSGSTLNGSLGDAIVGADGLWALTTPQLAEGAYTISASSLNLKQSVRPLRSTSQSTEPLRTNRSLQRGWRSRETSPRS